MKRCIQLLDADDPMVMASTCTQMVLVDEHYLCAYHRKLAMGMLEPEYPRAYNVKHLVTAL